MDFTKVKTYSIKKRKSRVDKALLARPLRPGASFTSFFGSLPNILKVNELKEVVSAVTRARRQKKPVILMMGAHVVKCGLSPLVIELIQQGVLTSVATNGAGIIHDFEIAYAGETSEDVVQMIQDGRFGMVRETADFLNAAIKEGVQEGRGLGESVGAKIAHDRLAYRDLSIAYACWKKRVPLTVHVAIGTDIIHQHPSFSGADTGEASARDFKKLCVEVSRLHNGGVVINVGSAVLMPEVFLKALSVARNLAGPVKNFTTANFDMQFQYRPQQNIVTRPVLGGGRGFYIVGHHEIMFPLLTQAILESLRR